jgi:hypothetical protein
MELVEQHRQLDLSAERDRAELRELLQEITLSNDELGAIGRLHFPAKAEIMQNIAEVCDLLFFG